MLDLDLDLELQELKQLIVVVASFLCWEGNCLSLSLEKMEKVVVSFVGSSIDSFQFGNFILFHFPLIVAFGGGKFRV